MTRRWRQPACLLVLVLVLLMVAPGAAPPASAGAGGSQPQPPRSEVHQASEDRAFTGMFAGQLLGQDGAARVDVGLEVKAGARNTYTATLYYGGLLGKAPRSAAAKDRLALAGSYRDFTLVLTGKTPLRFQYIHGRYTALDDRNQYRGHLARVIP
jgi:hypothetical protein